MFGPSVLGVSFHFGYKMYVCMYRLSTYVIMRGGMYIDNFLPKLSIPTYIYFQDISLGTYR